MIYTTLYFFYYVCILIFGLILSFAFCGIVFNRKNSAILSALFCFSGIIQLILFVFCNESYVWYFYPYITHLPLLLLLCLYYRKPIITAIASICAAYICCQPSKWAGLLAGSLGCPNFLSQLISLITLFQVGFVILRYYASTIANIYNKDKRSVIILSSIPIVYYIFDYTAAVYSELWIKNNRTVAEFLPFFLCIVYFLFCILYHQEYEKKLEMEQKERVIQVTVEQQRKEIDAIRQSEYEIRLLRHDMRLLLNNLELCVDKNDLDSFHKLITSYTESIEATSVKRFCESDVINYVLSSYNSKCEKNHIPFVSNIKIGNIQVDEMILSTILSNALDNAVHAQMHLPNEKRNIRLLMGEQHGHLLISIKNPYLYPPVMADGMPVTSRKGHGYGTQSIRYLTEKLGGNCMFSVDQQLFILRIII